MRVRFDARLSLDAGLDPKATLEGEIGLGLMFPLGGPPAPTAHAEVVAETTDDADGDKVTGDADQCPSRAEDHDDFEDGDGCPDIDNDGDRVLDDIDKCGLVPEAINGYQDDDGCPDTVPAELEAKLGVIAGLTFAAGKADLPAKADAMLQPYVALLAAEPSIKLLVIGHAGADEVVTTDDDAGTGERRPHALDGARRGVAGAARPRRDVQVAALELREAEHVGDHPAQARGVLGDPAGVPLGLARIAHHAARSGSPTSPSPASTATTARRRGSPPR